MTTQSFPLLYTTGSDSVDQILAKMVAHFETNFPERVRAYYLAGSYAEGHAVPRSDVDVFIVFKGAITQNECKRARAIGKECAKSVDMHLELAIGDETELQGMNRLPLKLSSRLLFGEDMRERIPLPEMEVYVRSVAKNPLRYSGLILRGRESLTLPLDYPDPFDEFYGYLHWRDGSKWLVAAVGAIVTARLALEARQYVPSRQHCASLYRAYLHDDWTDLVSQILERCKAEWHYGIPAQIDERRQFKALCQAMLGLENHYFTTYPEYSRLADAQ